MKPKRKGLQAMTTAQVSTGTNPVSIVFGSAELTEIISGGSGGNESVKILVSTLPDPSMIGKRHTISLKTPSNPSDVVVVGIFDASGVNPQSMPTFDAAGNMLSVTDNGVGILQYEREFLSFVWDGVRLVLDNGARMNENVNLPQVLYVPSPIGHADGETLKLVGGVPTWSL